MGVSIFVTYEVTAVSLSFCLNNMWYVLAKTRYCYHNQKLILFNYDQIRDLKFIDVSEEFYKIDIMKVIVIEMKETL